MKKSVIQILVLLLIVLLVPWLWSSTRKFINVIFYYQLLYFVSSLLFNIIFLSKPNSFWKLIILALVLIPLGMELMHFISFEIHWINNDVHYIDSSSGSVEMYKDYNSFIDFSYNDGNWRYRLLQAFYNVLIWCVPFGFFSLFRIYKERAIKKRKVEVLDSEDRFHS